MQQARELERYRTQLEWTGRGEQGTAAYASYGREYRVTIDGKPQIIGSASARFRGDPALPNPEELLIAAVSACHMLAYLALCARNGVRVVEYEDAATGVLTLHADGRGSLSEIVLTPIVTIAPDSDEALALQLHETAHEQCFIANSCSVPILHKPSIRRSIEV